MLSRAFQALQLSAQGGSWYKVQLAKAEMTYNSSCQQLSVRFKGGQRRGTRGEMVTLLHKACNKSYNYFDEPMYHGQENAQW